MEPISGICCLEGWHEYSQGFSFVFDNRPQRSEMASDAVVEHHSFIGIGIAYTLRKTYNRPVVSLGTRAPK